MTFELSSDPVLLGGENRSGTTVFSVVLDSHPNLVVGPELDFVEPPDLGAHIIEACELLMAGDQRVLGPGIETADPFWYHGAHFVKQCERFGIPPDVLVELVRKVASERNSNLESLVDRCRLIEVIGEYRMAETGAQRWGIKLQRKIARVDEFAAIWPRAKFVHIIRDGRDVAASHLKTVTWGYRQVADAATGWIEVVGRPYRVAPDDRYLEFRYEDLVSAPERTLRRLLDFVGVPWSDTVLKHTSLDHSLFHRPWAHPSADTSRNPLHPSRIGRYRQDLTREEIEVFERIAGGELARVGYVTGDR